MRESLSIGAVAVVALLAGCGGPGGMCVGLNDSAPPADVAASPRSDADAEYLALVSGDTVVADGSLYDDISADLAAIRQQFPVVADVHFWNAMNGTCGTPRTPRGSFALLTRSSPGRAQRLDGKPRQFGPARLCLRLPTVDDAGCGSGRRV